MWTEVVLWSGPICQCPLPMKSLCMTPLQSHSCHNVSLAGENLLLVSWGVASATLSWVLAHELDWEVRTLTLLGLIQPAMKQSLLHWQCPWHTPSPPPSPPASPLPLHSSSSLLRKEFPSAWSPSLQCAQTPSTALGEVKNLPGFSLSWLFFQAFHTQIMILGASSSPPNHPPN